MSGITRSAFLRSGAAMVAWPAFAGGEKPRLRFGFISDIHIGRARASADRVYKPALEWFRDQGVDAVVCTGDLATTGLLAELKHVSDVWYEVFPDDKLPDGRHVEKVFLYGNHDTSPTVERYSVRAGRAEEFKRASILTDRAKAWETHFREPFAPIYMKRINGYAFVVAHWEGLKPAVTGAPEYLKAHAAELAGDMPFFYCQHAALRGTVNPLSPGHFDDGNTTEALNGFPNAFALTGHSHSALTDETSIWQGGFTALCGAACANSGRRYVRPWFENSDVPGSPDGAYPNRKGAQMPELNTSKDGGQGLLVDVFDDRIVLKRHSFIFNEPVGPDWVVPLPLGREKPFLIDARRKASAPPEFAPGAAVSLAERDGTNREKEPVRQLVVSFPAASRGDRPFGYEVTVASDEPGTKPTVRCILSPDFHLPPTRRVASVECVFALAGLPPAGHRRVSVRAFNSLRSYGAPIGMREAALESAVFSVGCVNCGALHYGDGKTAAEEYDARWRRLAADWQQDVFFYEDVGKWKPGGESVKGLDIRAAAKRKPEAVDVVELPGEGEVRGKKVVTRRRRALRLVFDVGGRKLALYGVHLVAEGHISSSKKDSPDGLSPSQRLRREQFKALAEDAKGFDCAILTGDFNAQVADEYSVFTDAGFTIANCSGKYGTAATLRNIPADNIIISGGLSFEDFRVLDSYGLNTDHKPLVAKVRIR